MPLVPSISLRGLFYKTLGLFSIAVLLLCAWYFTVGITFATSLATFGILIPVSFFLFRISFLPSSSFLPRTRLGIMLFGIGIFCLLTVGLLCVSLRTGEALISPWNILPFAVFPLYGIGLLCTMLLGHIEENDAFLLLGIPFVFTSTSVAAIVYAHGFGFDPFLHRAAETALVTDGFIHPLQLLYSGQYTLVAALTHLTGIPLKWIDIWLLPLLASLLLPMGAAIGLQDGWRLSSREARTWWPIILLIPFSLITFTVPFTVTYLFFLLFCVLFPTLRHKPSFSQYMFLGSLFAAIFFHPLLAFPMFLFALGMWLRSRLSSLLGRIATGLGTLLVLAASVPAMLFASHASSASPSFSLLVQNKELFLNLFRSPYWDPYPFIPWTLQALYGFRYWLPMILFSLGLIFLTHKRFRGMRTDAWIFAAGILLTIWGTSTLFSFKDIIVHEQAEFALRLLQACFTFPLPIFAVVLAGLVRRFKWALIPSVLMVASCVTIAWYFSYPQFNLKYPFFSPGVGNDDITAVHDIDVDANGEPYLVLVHQMTSAAAIQEFGFSQIITLDGEEILRYPIPTGGKLYPYYEDLIYNGVTREKIDALQEKTGVKNIYLVTHDYWSWSEGMLQSLANAADTRIREPSLTIWIFYYRNP